MSVREVLSWLERSAERRPDKVSVSDPEEALTFAELTHMARGIGTWLARDAHVRPHDAVALFLEKSPRALAAMLGAAYAGGFYCVIDVRQTAPRVAAIADALDPALIITDAACEGRARKLLGHTARAIVTLDEICGITEDEAVLTAAQAEVIDTDPLYVNFTSGSTGTPKGVVVAERSVIDFIPVFTRTFAIDETDVIANQAPFDFDVSVKDIYTALLTGATMHLVPRTYFSNPTQLMDYLVEVEATTLTWAVSALCFVSIMGGLDYKVPESVRRVLFSGEVMPPKQLGVWQRTLPEARYVNLYGPTEICCNCTYFEVERTFAADEVIPMGKAFENERVYLMDEAGHIVTEPGQVGEVCVSGTCVALGYLGDAERTAASFTSGPKGARWVQPTYLTGDLARYDEEGLLVYVSRKDNQIKHLGQRIELGDIECAAQATDGVERACCLYDHTRKRLVLCYVGTIERKALKEHLRELLPSYMVPNNTRQLEELPLTKNGKIDRVALAALARIKR